jgi:methionine-rich copper-binding protein CopC
MHILRSRLAVSLSLALVLAAPSTSALAHARPQTSSPAPGQRLDTAPPQIAVTYDDSIDPSGSSLVLIDASGAQVPTMPGALTGARQASITPMDVLAPGPYTINWNSVDSNDGHDAHGFYTFVVNGGAVGIINGLAQSQAPAADLMATLTVTAGSDGASLLRVDLNKPDGVERVRIRLSRPDLGDALLDTHASGDGGWVLDGNEVALPGAWSAEVIVRRTNIFDDAQAPFSFSIDPATGSPAFG